MICALLGTNEPYLERESAEEIHAKLTHMKGKVGVFSVRVAVQRWVQLPPRVWTILSGTRS